MKRIFLVATLSLSLAGLAFGHAGVTNFIPTVPDPTAMNIDGLEDDWGWFDPDFAQLPDAFVDSGNRSTTGQDDWSSVQQWGWTPPPDNALFFFTRIFDDTLRAESADRTSWWNNDNLQMAFDLDHGGGNTTVNDDPTQFQNGYRHHINPLFAPVVGISMGGLAGDPAGQPHWGGEPPWGFVAGIMLPADADHYSANVEYTIEFKIHPHDIYDPDSPDNTIAHVNGADQIVHIASVYEDGDLGDHGGQNRWVQVGGETADTVGGDSMIDWQLIQTVDSLEGYPCGTINGGSGDPRFAGDCTSVVTAVEHSTWARIKGHLSR